MRYYRQFWQAERRNETAWEVQSGRGLWASFNIAVTRSSGEGESPQVGKMNSTVEGNSWTLQHLTPWITAMLLEISIPVTGCSLRCDYLNSYFLSNIYDIKIQYDQYNILGLKIFCIVNKIMFQYKKWIKSDTHITMMINTQKCLVQCVLSHFISWRRIFIV